MRSTRVALSQTSGYSNFFYPSLIDPASPDANFGQVGANAFLYLVGNACVGASPDPSGSGLVCSPFTPDGQLVRDILRTTVSFNV